MISSTAPSSCSELRTGIRTVERPRAKPAWITSIIRSAFTRLRNCSSVRKSMLIGICICLCLKQSNRFRYDNGGSNLQPNTKYQLLLSLPCPGQNPAHLLGRHGKPLGHACNFPVFFFPDFWNYNFGKLLCQFLKCLLTCDSLRPRAQQRIDATFGHHFLLQQLKLFPEIVIVHRL